MPELYPVAGELSSSARAVGAGRVDPQHRGVRHVEPGNRSDEPQCVTSVVPDQGFEFGLPVDSLHHRGLRSHAACAGRACRSATGALFDQESM